MFWKVKSLKNLSSCGLSRDRPLGIWQLNYLKIASLQSVVQPFAVHVLQLDCVCLIPTKSVTLLCLGSLLHLIFFFLAGPQVICKRRNSLSGGLSKSQIGQGGRNEPAREKPR